MIFDNTVAPPVNWASLRYEFAMAQSAGMDELEKFGCIQPATLERMRAVIARAEMELAITLAKFP